MVGRATAHAPTIVIAARPRAVARRPSRAMAGNRAKHKLKSRPEQARLPALRLDPNETVSVFRRDEHVADAAHGADRVGM
jgi:hypothetical protein